MNFLAPDNHATDPPAQRLPSLSRLCLRRGAAASRHARRSRSRCGRGAARRPVCSGCHAAGAGLRSSAAARASSSSRSGASRSCYCTACGGSIAAPAGSRSRRCPGRSGKHQLTKAYMLFLAHWARKLSWKETAQSFHTSWDKVCHAVEYVVQWGLEHRTLGPIRAIGVDEIAYAKGHKYLTLVYQIEAGCTRLLWVGKERTVESFEGFFALIGKELAQQDRVRLLGHVEALPGADPQALHQRAEYPGPLPRRGQDEPGARRCARRRGPAAGPGRLRARAEEIPLVPAQAQGEPDRHSSASACAMCCATTSRPCAPTCSRKTSSSSGTTTRPPGRASSSTNGAARPCARASSRMKKFARTVRTPPRAAAQLFPRPKGVLQRRHRGPEQQSQSHHEKILRLSNLQAQNSPCIMHLANYPSQSLPTVSTDEPKNAPIRPERPNRGAAWCYQLTRTFWQRP